MISVKAVTLLLITITSVSASCAYGTSIHPRDYGTVPVSKFGYTSLQGPLNWYGLNTAANSLCAKGKNQSPIVIDSSIGTAQTNLIVVDIPPVEGAKFENLGTTVEVVVNGSLQVVGKEYSLVQFHFHTPSEHRFFEEFYPMESHFVFEAKDSTIAVLGFVIQLCSEFTDPFLSSVFASIEDIAIPGTYTTTGPLDFEGLEKHFLEHNVYTYNGSLTIPPCSEGINWLISAEPLLIDVKTYNRVKKIVKFNSRYTQNTLGQTNLLEVEANTLARG